MAERGPHVPAFPVQLLSISHVSELLCITFLSLLSPTGLSGPSGSRLLIHHPGCRHQSTFTEKPAGPGPPRRRAQLSEKRAVSTGVRVPGLPGLIGYELWTSHPSLPGAPEPGRVPLPSFPEPASSLWDSFSMHLFHIIPY